MIEVFFNGEFHTANSLAHASIQFRAYLDANNMGASDMQRNDGRLRENGKPAGRVSYNGRVWDLQGKEIS